MHFLEKRTQVNNNNELFIRSHSLPYYYSLQINLSTLTTQQFFQSHCIDSRWFIDNTQISRDDPEVITRWNKSEPEPQID